MGSVHQRHTSIRETEQPLRNRCADFVRARQSLSRRGTLRSFDGRSGRVGAPWCTSSDGRRGMKFAAARSNEERR